MRAAFRAPDWVDESVDDYAEDHSHVGDRSNKPLRTDEVANGGASVPIAITKE